MTIETARGPPLSNRIALRVAITCLSTTENRDHRQGNALDRAKVCPHFLSRNAKYSTNRHAHPYRLSIAVGDGANDLPMLGIAGMGIAFRAKPIVRQTAGHAVSFLGLDSLLYLIGVRERDLSSVADRS